jgi:hypothetical protein
MLGEEIIITAYPAWVGVTAYAAPVTSDEILAALALIPEARATAIQDRVTVVVPALADGVRLVADEYGASTGSTHRMAPRHWSFRSPPTRGCCHSSSPAPTWCFNLRTRAPSWTPE